MSVLHDYECAAHGVFESFEQKCPYGCAAAFVRLVFLKPVGTRSNSTKVADASIRALAADFGLSNVGSYGGESVRDYLRRGQSMDPNNQQLNFAPMWQQMPHASPGFSQEKNPNIPKIDPQAAIGGSTAQGENAVTRMFGQTEDGRVQSLPRPRPVIDPKLTYRPDPADYPQAPA